MGEDDLLLKYWDDLPREMRVEALLEGNNQREILQRAAEELDLEFEFEAERGHVSKENIAEFVVAIMEAYGDG